MKPAELVDAAIEAPIVTSFTKIGYLVRKSVHGWRPLWDYDLRGRTVAITGPTSGLGEAAAEWFARLGATLVLVARDPDKVQQVAERLESETGNPDISCVIADLGQFDTVRTAAAEIAASHPRVDVLIHNAGALFNERRTQSDGIETTVAVHVIGPFLLTGLLLDRMSGGRVITMSSGGMYAAPLAVRGLEMDPDDYQGARQYALAKRAQVTLNEMWADRVPATHFHAMHPGWADTPGVSGSLPGFRRIVGPLLRNPDQGADTMVWLAADDGEPAVTSGKFWLDRKVRSIHKLDRTRRSDTDERRQRLWRWVADRAGWDLP
ncbi:MAG: SDR family NAD(P)-dependent oxidoreductase [Acidimicrobiia bacterium]|nr:SDR family NAD(P)-dependent oxidoreductase [Acidimicrobiia bacterium]